MDDTLEMEIKQLIVESLMLEDVKPEDIQSDDALFVEGLGLDSIDALELAMAIHKRFGVRTSPDDEHNRENFHSVAALAAFVRAGQAKNAAAAAEAAAAAGASDPA